LPFIWEIGLWGVFYQSLPIELDLVAIFSCNFGAIWERKLDISGFVEHFDFLAKRKKGKRNLWPKLPHDMTLAKNRSNFAVFRFFWVGGYVGMDFVKKMQ